MAVYDNRHTRRVAFLKVALPLLALAILSTLFLVADRRGTNETVPFSTVEMDRMIADQEVSGPNYATVTEDGSALSITARSVSPGVGNTEEGTADSLIATLEDPSGTRIDLSAPTGQFDTRAGTAVLRDGVSVRSTSGFQLRGDGFRIDAEQSTVESTGPVEGSGPPGTLTAGRMSVTRENADYLLNFTDGVKLIYDPSSTNGD